MILKVLNVNFSTEFDWIFKLIDSEHNEYFVMDNNFYSNNGLKTPIKHNHLDTLDIGHSINSHFKTINTVKIITSFL